MEEEPNAPGTTFYRVMYKYTQHGDLRENKDDLLWLFGKLLDPEELDIYGLANVTAEIERLMSDPKQKERVSPYVAQKFSSVAIAAEIRNQLRIYRPRTFVDAGNQTINDKAEQDFSEWAFELAEQIRGVMSYMIPSLGGGNFVHPNTDGGPTTWFEYPVSKRRTKETNEVMQRAEKNLDEFWGKYDAQLRSRVTLKQFNATKSLLPYQRQLQRTPDLVEPIRLKPVKAKNDTDLADDVSRINLELEKRTEGTIGRDVAPTAKSKPKTRGAAQISTTSAEKPEETTVLVHQPRFSINKRAAKVFATIFHNTMSQDQPGEIAWTEFLYAMVATGFAPEKLYVSYPILPMCRSLVSKRGIQYACYLTWWP